MSESIASGEVTVTAADGQTADFLWKVIARYDVYLTNTVAKAALLGTFDIFVLGAVVLRWKEIVTPFQSHPHLVIWAASFVITAAICTLLSFLWLLLAVFPFLRSEGVRSLYHSNVFFMHVSMHKDGEAYLAHLLKSDAAGRVTDLTRQAHALAVGLAGKQRKMQAAVGVTIVGLAAISLFLVCLLLSAIF